MKRKGLKIAAAFLLAAALCIVYLATPIRPAIAKATADRYLMSHYAQYELAPVEIVGTGHTEYRNLFTWVNGYSAQSRSSEYIAVVELNGWLPFLVDESKLWRIEDGETIPIDP